MKAQIQLPDELLIDYLFFCKAIAQAICPARELELKGVDCITGKRVTNNFTRPVPGRGDEKWPVTAAWQCVLLSDDGRTLDQRRMDQLDAPASSTPLLPFGGELRHNVFELTLPYKLSDKERQMMEKLLADLPALRYPMSEDEVATFMRAYFDLPNRPYWEPILVTAATIEQRQVEQDAIMLRHQKALQDELTRGRIVAVDSNHVPVARFAFGAFLPRDQAIAYLDQCGILHCDKPVDNHRVAESQTPAIHPEPLKGEQGAVSKLRLSDKQRHEIVTLHNELKRKGVKDFCKQVVEKFGVSDSYVRRLVRQAPTKQNADHHIVKVWGTHKKRK
ncbi:hypothetical protein ACO0LO_15655 [Undibacterium sp. TJN25]|uniref:hypothetical protein n=1 Tax=Undibacterium sp. TJN25 TaxID=3413056 RepID=UPI003BF22625